MHIQVGVSDQIAFTSSLQVLLNGASRDPSEAVRKAARSALAQLPLSPLSLLPLLTISDKAAAAAVDTPAPKTRRRSKAESSGKHAAEGLDILELAGMLQPVLSFAVCAYWFVTLFELTLWTRWLTLRHHEDTGDTVYNFLHASM